MTDRDTDHTDPKAQPAQTAVVALAARSDQDGAVRSFAVTRHDPSFVTQLIATAAQMPQTRTLRRASPEHAQTIYRAAVNSNRPGTVLKATSRVA